MEAVSTTPGESFLLKFRLCLGKFRKVNRIFVFQKKIVPNFSMTKQNAILTTLPKNSISIFKNCSINVTQKPTEILFWCFDKVGVFFRGKMLDT